MNENQAFSAVRMMIDQVNFERGSGVWSSDALHHLIDAIYSILNNLESSTEALLHLPEPFLSAFTERFHQPLEIGADQLIMCSSSGLDEGMLTWKSLGTIPDRHPFQDELLIAVLGKSLCALAVAYPERARFKIRQTTSRWCGLITFHHADIVAGGTFLLDYFASELRLVKVRNWFNKIVTLLRHDRVIEAGHQHWGNSLFELASNMQPLDRSSSEELNWYQLISHIQDAVGWERNMDRLFESIAKVLKETIGYHYLELQLFHQTQGLPEMSSSYNHNDTTYQGSHIALILKSEVQERLLFRQKPELVDGSNPEEIFANILLYKRMLLESGILVPLVYKNRATGLLKLFSCQRGRYEGKDVSRMEAIGRILDRSLENVNEYLKMRHKAMVDALTNVYNRRFFSDQLMREFIRARRYSSHLSLIMIDIDYFKHYNDTNGHLAGDEVLKSVAQVIKSGVRETDLVARYGGEEFAIILPETAVSEGKIVAEKIRQTIASHPFPKGGDQPAGKVTISAGLASNESGVKTVNELITLADRALYYAKRNGRNNCATYSEERQKEVI